MQVGIKGLTVFCGWKGGFLYIIPIVPLSCRKMISATGNAFVPPCRFVVVVCENIGIAFSFPGPPLSSIRPGGMY